jgi:cysteine desulfuration protein SufE
VTNKTSIAERVDEIVAEFTDLEPRERLELLLEYANDLPPLPSAYEAQRLAGEHRVHECQTPVFLWADLADGLVQVHGWVAPEAPTVKGFVGIVAKVFSNASPAEALACEVNLVQRLGLVEALGMARMRGLSAVLFYVRKKIQILFDDAASHT